MKRLIGFNLMIVVLVLAIGCSKTSVTLTADEQLAYDVAAIDDYLATNHINAIKLESGIRYAVTEQGNGPLPTKDNCVTFAYTLYVVPDTEMKQENTTGYTAALKSQIIGMQIVLKLLPTGSKATILIPSALAYGPSGRPSSDAASNIPRNAILRFDIQLISLKNYNALGNYCYQ